ncbi:MAG: putative excinuclease subunit domain protein [Candidatus Saccharibacteria bacterium]|nr:putative excinuclease subunit domain protein [Candidatus Saccharibacteria bacterium]
MISPTLEKKLKELPREPGVYFHKDASGEIIYVGKAAVLRNRVRQYFQKSRTRDVKTDALVAEIADTDWMVVESEIEALFLEAEMVRRYMPRYNILLRDDKAMAYIRIDYDSDYPTVSTTRRPLDDGAKYFGPYPSLSSVRVALKLLRRIFPYATRKIPGQKRATLHYHLGLDPGLEEGRTTLEQYRANLRQLMAYIEGKRVTIIRELEKEMKAAAKQQNFEEAAHIRNRLTALQNLNKQVIFSDKEFMDISKDHALNELVDLLGLHTFPQRMEGYDISHMSGTDVVASMVVFTNGVSDKAEYRKFKTKKDHNNDFHNMYETLSRRLSEKNIKAWGRPSLVLIDGGKGQLDAAIRARDEACRADKNGDPEPSCQQIPFIGLAKREEQIVIHKDKSNVALNQDIMHKLQGFMTESDDFILVNLPHNTNLVKLLQRIRDESHRFAVSYHSVLRQKRQTASLLEEIPGFGPATRRKLLKEFGSMKGVAEANQIAIEQSIGAKKAAILRKYL